MPEVPAHLVQELDVGTVPSDQGLSRNASSVSFGHAEHCFLTVWTPKIL